MDEVDCEACGKDQLEFWYNIDMIGHSIQLPLNDDAVRNLQAAYDIDAARAAEVLRASSKRDEDLFREIGHKLPKEKLKELALCRSCVAEQQFLAWVEELCQIMDIVHSMEEKLLADKRVYDGRWRGLKARPESLAGLRFCDIPWPIRGSQTLTSPKQLTKSGVRRFLFSRCIYEKYAFMNGRHPRGLLIEYKMRWDQKWFKRHLPWYCRALPSFVAERAAILEGVALIGRYIKELEEDNWEVVLGDDPSKAQWNQSIKYPLHERRPELECYKPEKWVRERIDNSIDYISLVISAGCGLVFSLLS
jgi:hypothetical protein